MFDASEILFLSTAVEMNLLTPNQRERLMEYQDQLEPGYGATQLVVDAGLMVDEEVGEVLEGIQQGMAATSVAEGGARPSQPAPETPKSISEKTGDGVRVATSLDVDSIINMGEGGEAYEEAEAYAYQEAEGAAAASSEQSEQAQPEGEASQEEPAGEVQGSRAHELFQQAQEEQGHAEESGASGQPAFPMPGGGNPHYTGDVPESSSEEIGSFSAYGSQEDINREWEELEEDAEERQAAAPVEEKPKARDMASSADEIAAMMDDDE